MTSKWLKMSEIYRRFASDWEDVCDFSESALIDMFDYESTGKGNLSIGVFSDKKPNGYAVGKHWMDVTVAMWKEDLKTGIISVAELSADFPEWFILKMGVK